mgnify:CR=1 FL=1
MFQEQSREKYKIKNAFNEKQYKIFKKKVDLGIKHLDEIVEYEQNKMLYKLEYKK